MTDKELMKIAEIYFDNKLCNGCMEAKTEEGGCDYIICAARLSEVLRDEEK